MTTTQYLPNRGDIVWMVFDPTIGREQTGRRPALVLSDSNFTAISGLTIVCPVTSRIRRIPSEVPLMGLKTKGVVLPAQVKSMDISQRQAVFIEKAFATIIEETTKKVGVFIGINLQ